MAFLVWALLGCSAVYWAIQLGAKPLTMQAQVVGGPGGGAAVDLSRLLGAPVVAQAAPAAAQESRFKLLGVVAPKSARAAQAGEGVALIAVDGVARTVRVGATLDNDLQLLAVDARSASLGKDGVTSLRLELAAPTAAATGALAPASPSPLNLGGPMPSPQALPQQLQQQMQQQAGAIIAQPDRPAQQPGPPVDNQGNPPN